MNKELRIKEPSGRKKIEVKINEILKIYLEDFERGSRAFYLEVVLDGANARCEIVGRVQAIGRDKKTWKVIQRAFGQDQVIKIDLHGTAEDEGELDFDGAAVIESGSRNAEVSVVEKIWCFDRAKGKSLPTLTVKTDRVKSAHHSASITPVDAGALFFLESRGIEKKEAKVLLKEGFLQILDSSPFV